MRKLSFYGFVMAIAAFFSFIPAYADWGPWQSIGDGQVQVSFNQVKNDTCAWKIRNSGSNTLKTFDFSYTYVPADSPYSSKTDRDVLPYPLKPNAVIGGWTAYAANTHRCPVTLVTLKLERSN
jgi:hypothetical protein